ncbi:MAG: hypothetical protein ABIO04_14085 [Ferruginibacter sp.]
MKTSSVLNYLAALIIVSVVMLLLYTVMQQSYRTGLNDPQIQIARDISFKLSQGQSAHSLLGDDTIDAAKSLSPFIVLYDLSGRALLSNGVLAGKLPQLPLGVFETARSNDEHDVSWQPKKGVRIAMVIEKSNALPIGFVAVGRSMREVENRTANMRSMVLIAWIICVSIILTTWLLHNFSNRKKRLKIS